MKLSDLFKSAEQRRAGAIRARTDGDDSLPDPYLSSLAQNLNELRETVANLAKRKAKRPARSAAAHKGWETRRG